jgi:hypothetical protein
MPPREKATLGQKIFWSAIALSSVACAIYGYERFKLIRPDLYDPRYQPSVSETERKSRIAEYQQRGDALSRAGNAPMRTLRAGEVCAVDGYIMSITNDSNVTDAKRLMENGRPVRCAPIGPPHP